MPEKQLDERVSEVSVSIRRVLNTRQYESLELELVTKEQIRWNSNLERSKKIENITALLASQYIVTQSKVLDELGIEPKAAWFKKTHRESSLPADSL